MIGLVKSPFFEIEQPLNGNYLSKLTPYFLAEEEIFKSFKNFDFFAHFTNKRIIFTYYPDGVLNPSHFEIEFLPYRSIQRFSFLSNDKLSHYSIELTVCDVACLSFVLCEKSLATDLAKKISKFTV